MVAKNFRPISLVNCSMKLLTKIMTVRLEQVIDKIIDPVQIGFMHNRNILDNIVIANELIHDCYHSSQQGVIIKIDFEKAYDKVNWTFLREVLQHKGFSASWQELILQTCTSASTCINFNGEFTNSFQCGRGLRQGDPMSPYLFNIVADSLCRLFQNSRNQNIILGLGPPCLHSKSITNIHYADDTLLFLQANPTNIENAFWLMKGFEAMSGITMNLEKTEMLPVNIDTAQCNELANIFSCNVGTFPLHYLGMPISYKKLNMQDWIFLADKMLKKLQTWQGHFLSMGGRVTMLNAVISAIPLYMMSVYRLPIKIRNIMDRYRRQFLWQGCYGGKRKYALISWKYVCMHKDYGGLGVLDLDTMNISLLLKWWWRFNDPSYSSLWKDIIVHKYRLNSSSKSYFWSHICKLEPVGYCAKAFQPISGSNIKFWTDIWSQNCSMATKFDWLYDLCSNKTVTLQQVVQHKGLNLQFSRTLTGVLAMEFQELLTCLPHLTNTGTDIMIFRWNSAGTFTTKDTYSFLNFRGVTVDTASIWWENPVPHKIKIFMWLLSKNRILTKDTLVKKGWQGDIKCVFCDHDETRDHLFLFCQYSRKLWFWLGEMFDQYQFIQNFTDVTQVLSMMTQKDRLSFLLVLSALCWNIWIHRNSIIFQQTQKYSIRQMLIKVSHCVMFWAGNSKEEVQQSISKWMPPNWDEIPLTEVQPQLMIEDTKEEGVEEEILMT